MSNKQNNKSGVKTNINNFFKISIKTPSKYLKLELLPKLSTKKLELELLPIKNLFFKLKIQITKHKKII